MIATHYSEIGKLFADARAHRRMSLEQASRQLHIRVRYLEALEQGHLEQLPGQAYTKGYLLRYADFLDLDKQEVLRRFAQIEAMMEKRSFFLPEAFHKEKSPTPQMIALGAAAVLGAYGLWWLSSEGDKTVSVVERFPSTLSGHIAVGKIPHTVCMISQEQAYPPCDRMWEKKPEVALPLHAAQYYSILSLSY